MTAKRRTHRRKRHTGLSATRTHRKSHRRTHRRARGFMSELTTPATAQATGKAILWGCLGAFVGSQIPKLMPNNKPIVNAAIGGVLAYLTGTMLKLPAAASGVAGMTLITLIEKSKAGMSENYLSQSDLAKLPEVLGESYMTENYLQAGSPAFNYAAGIDRF